MKKFWIIIAIVGIVGLLLATAGMAMGAKTDGFYVDKGGLHMYSGRYTLDRQTNIEEITEIKIDVSIGKVKIINADYYGYEINDREEATFDYSFSNGKLTVTQKKFWYFAFLSFGDHKEYVNIYLPDNAKLDVVDIKNDVGQVDINNLTCNSLLLKLSVGEAVINDLSINTGSISVSAGSLRIQSAEIGLLDIKVSTGDFIASNIQSDGLKVDVSTGSARLSGTFSGNTTLKVSTGSVRMDIAGSEQDYNRTVEVSIGDFTINDQKASFGNVNNNVANNLDIKVSVGDISLNFSK